MSSPSPSPPPPPSPSPPDTPPPRVFGPVLPPPQPHVHHPALDLFPDGGFVRLRSRANRKYVHADEDLLGVSLRQHGGGPLPLVTVWRVHHWPVDEEGDSDTAFVLLQGTAYGRYLAVSPDGAPPGHLGLRAIQGDLNQHDFLETLDFKWVVDRVDAHHDYVRLRMLDRSLRANGRIRTWNTGVTVDFDFQGRITTMMQWTVEAVAASPSPLPILITPQAPNYGGGRGLLRWRRAGHGVHAHPPRMIRHVRADDQGNFNQNHHDWPSFPFRSIFNLMTQVGLLQQDWNGDIFGFTLCAWPGFNGRLMPLVTDLPRRTEPMNIVVLTTGSPAAVALVYPQIDAPAP